MAKKRGVVVLRGDWYPNAHYELTWINWELNLVYLWNLASLCHIPKEINWSKKSTKTAVWKLVSGFLSVFKRLSTTSLGKFLRKSTYIRYVIAELSKLVQISMLASSDSFKKKGWPLFYRIFFKTILQCYINWPNFITRLFSSNVIQ